MKNSTLIQLLRKMSRKELKEFDLAVNSPLFNSQKTVIVLFNQLKKYIPQFEDDSLNRERVFSIIYPGKNYNGELMRRVVSDLKKVLEDYIVYKALKEKDFRTGIMKAEEYLKRELLTEAEKILDSLLKQLNTGRINAETLGNFIELYALKTKLYFSLNRQEKATEEMRNQFLLNFYFFFLRNAYNLHDIRVNKIIFNSSIENDLVNKLLGIISYEDISKYIGSMEGKNKFQKISLVYLLGTLNYMNSDSTEYYEPLINAAADTIEEFDAEEKYNIYQMLEAIAWYKSTGINSLQYRIELFRINRMRLESGVYSPDGRYMRLMLYRQILMTAITLHELDWAEDFVKNYSGKLPKEHKVNMENFSYAQIYFGKRQFEKALELINRVSFEMFALKLDSRNLILKIYYELGYYEEAYSLIDAYKHFLTDNRNISEYYRELATGFLNYYSKLLKIKISHDEYGIQKLLDSIKNTAVWQKEWIVEKAKLLNT